MEKKYIPLAAYFQNASADELTLTYNEIENILGQQLPNAAYLNASWWRKIKTPYTHFEAWSAFGYHVDKVRIGNYVTFSRNDIQKNATTSKDVIIIREIELHDVKAFINLQQDIYNSSNNHPFGKEELFETVQSVKKEMTRLKKAGLGTHFLSIVNGKIVGFLSILRYSTPRYSHVAKIHLAKLPSYDQAEIEQSLLVASETWAREHSILRLEVTVMEKHSSLLSTFLEFNFAYEGVRKKAFSLHGQLLDELYLSKFID